MRLPPKLKVTSQPLSPPKRKIYSLESWQHKRPCCRSGGHLLFAWMQPSFDIFSGALRTVYISGAKHAFNLVSDFALYPNRVDAVVTASEAWLWHRTQPRAG